MSATADRVGELVAPLLSADVALYDVEYEGAVLRVVIDRPGGVDVGTLAEVTRSISVVLDETDPIDGRYTLEVSSPGLERRLRTREHFLGAVGQQVQIKTRPGTPGDRRCRGRLSSVGDRDVTLTLDDGAAVVVQLGDITRAQVHVDWSPPPKPGGPKQRTAPVEPLDDTPDDPSTEPEPTHGEHR